MAQEYKDLVYVALKQVTTDVNDINGSEVYAALPQVRDAYLRLRKIKENEEPVRERDVRTALENLVFSGKAKRIVVSTHRGEHMVPHYRAK